MKLFSMYSNLCDHDTSTSQTDGRTNCRSNTALCLASRGENARQVQLFPACEKNHPKNTESLRRWLKLKQTAASKTCQKFRSRTERETMIWQLRDDEKRENGKL